jgi:acyl-CoA synthetase (AMP-forming)/AMP-acid ligase II
MCSRSHLGRTHLVDRCRDLAQLRGEQIAFTWLDDGEREANNLSFAQLDHRALHIAAALAARGLSGERALLAYAPGLEFIAAFLGCLYAGVLAVPISTPRDELAAQNVLGIARDATPSVLLTDRLTHERGARWFSKLGSIEVLLTESLDTPAPCAWRPASVDPRAVAFLQYTSGSTSAPKGVEVTHANMIANARMIGAAFEQDERTVLVSWLPLYHDMGLIGTVLQALFLGVRCVLMSPSAFIQHPVRWLRAISRYGATTSGGPDFGFRLCLQRVRDEELAQLDLSSWNVAFNGAEPVRADTLERFTERFASVEFRRTSFYPCFGLAEATLFVSGGDARASYVTLDVDSEALELGLAQPVTPQSPNAHRLVGCGRAWLDGRLLIVDPSSREECAEDVVGEICVAGPHVARGYRNRSAEHDDPFRAFLACGAGPFLRTGDLGFVSRGELFVTGRLKDLLIHNGRNYYPQDIEWAAGLAHEGLRSEGTVAFLADERAQSEERLVVVQEVHERLASILARDDEASRVLQAEVSGAVRHAVVRRVGLAVWKVVLIEPRGQPRTTSGKVQRGLTRTLWRQGALPELGRAAIAATAGGEHRS